ncbi:MAG: OmpA family protein [Gemmatimonadaceae bacterium]|nr:OmpA family protein [Gemmatimonadaceae bacterium]
MRNLRSLTLGAVIAAAMALAIPASADAQRQGAIEIGGFGRYTKYMDTLKLDPTLGAGGRVGIYAFRNWLAELELSYADADVNQPMTGESGRDSLRKVSDAMWSYRMTYNHPLAERVKLLLGAGYGYHSYGRVRQVAPRGGGPQGLVGLRFILNNRLSARVEGTGTFIMPADDNAKPVARATGLNLGAQAGLSPVVLHQPAETPYSVRYRHGDADSARHPVHLANRHRSSRWPVASPDRDRRDQLRIQQERYHARSQGHPGQDRWVADCPTNAARTIDVTGNTDAIGSEKYNVKLGQDRADQAKAYLVSKGVADSRINARTAGETDPIAPNTTDNGRATNRRVLVMLTKLNVNSSQRHLLPLLGYPSAAPIPDRCGAHLVCFAVRDQQRQVSDPFAPTGIRGHPRRCRRAAITGMAGRQLGGRSYRTAGLQAHRHPSRRGGTANRCGLSRTHARRGRVAGRAVV